MTNVRELSNAVWAVLIAQAPAILSFNTPTYPTPPTGQWWVYYPEGGTRSQDRLGAVSSELLWGFDLICVGRSIEQCMNVVDKADTLLIGRQVDNHASTSVLTQLPNGARMLPEASDPIGARFSINRQYRLTTRS